MNQTNQSSTFGIVIVFFNFFLKKTHKSIRHSLEIEADTCAGYSFRREGFYGASPIEDGRAGDDFTISNWMMINKWIYPSWDFLTARFGSLKQPISLEGAPRAETDTITVPAGPSKPWLPSFKRLHNCGKSSFLLGKLTISMAIFKSYVSHNQRVKLRELAKSCTSHFSMATRWSHWQI